MNDHTIKIPEGVEPANFNVRYNDSLDAVRKWKDAHEIDVKVFENFDGGGFNFYICEFASLKDALLFRKEFKIEGDRTLWVENAQGEIHYLNEECDTASPASVPDEAQEERKPHVTSLARPGFVPITLEQLNLSEDDMGILAEGSGFLYGNDNTTPGLETDPDA